MKKIILAVCVFISLTSTAQKLSKDTLIKRISESVCEELEKVAKDNKKVTNLETTLGLVLLPSFTKYSKEIKEVYGFDALEDNDDNKLAEDVGVYAALHCPVFMQILSENSEATSNLINKDKKVNSTIEGTFIKLTEGEFSFIEIKNNKGKSEKLYWMEYFEGANDLLANLSKWTNKKVKVDYTEKEVYRSAIKDYYKIKIITSIQLDK
jgi:hypothetical protein